MKRRIRRMPLGAGSGVGVLAALLVFAGIALAALGLQNPSFESGLDNWVVKTDRGSASNRTIVYGDGGKKGQPVPCDDKPYGICVVGTDTFDFVDGSWSNVETATVSPVDGDSMLRLGGPYEHIDVPQLTDRFVAQQTFTVDPANPVLQMNYNIFTYDYSGYDEFEFKVTLQDENGQVVARETQGSFGTGTNLKTTGWQPNQIDLSAFAGEELLLTLASGGTSDTLYPFWTYVDAGLVPAPPTSGQQTSATAPSLPGGGSVNLNKHIDPSTGQAFYTAPASQASLFPGGCMPLTLDVPINAGSGVVSDVSLLFNGESIAMSDIGGGVWRATIDCAESGSLAVEYDLTEEGVTQHFVVPLGGIVLIDPQGVVYDESDYDAAVAAGMTPEEARAEAAISGATVRLQRQTDGSFVNVLSGDPGISPNVNPQITGADGLYQWDVEAGTYRVVVSKTGYVGVTSPSVVIPPPVLDLHIPMEEYQTAITSGPSGSTTDNTPTFGFSANDPAGSTFECRIDSAPFAPCSGAASHTAGALSTGNHTFAVRGTDSNGYLDPTPATRAFTVSSPPNPPNNGCANARQALMQAQARFDAASDAADDAQAKEKKAKAKAKKAKAKAKKSDSKKADKKAKKAKAKAKKAKAASEAADEDARDAESGLAKAQAAVNAACG